jgi:hypothetical protein
MDVNNFQRVGAKSNAHAGREFEGFAAEFFAQQGLKLTPAFSTPIGVGEFKKPHKFDLGSDDPPILVECKSHTWTSGGKSPSAKIRAMNEAMYYFHLAPNRYRKVLFVLKHLKKEVSLATHYVKTQEHLLASGVEIWEYDLSGKSAERVR